MLSLRIDPTYSLSYDGSKLSFLDAKHICYLSARGIAIKNIHDSSVPTILYAPSASVAPNPSSSDSIVSNSSITSSGSRLSNTSSSINCYATNTKRGLLAYSCAKQDTEITVLSYPNLTEKYRLLGGSKSGYSAMAISRGGSYLACISHVADEPYLYIWDIEAPIFNKRHQQEQQSNISNSPNRLLQKVALPGKGFTQLSFWPNDKNVLVVYGDKVGMHLVRLQKSLNELTTTVSPILSNEENVTSLCWLPNRTLYVTTLLGELLTIGLDPLDATDKIIERQVLMDISARPGWKCVDLLLSKTHLIISGNDGCIRWLHLRTMKPEHTALISKEHSSIIKKEQTLSKISHAVASPAFDKLILGTYNGYIYSTDIDIPVQQNLDEDVSPQQQQEGGVGGLDNSNNNGNFHITKSQQLDVVQTYHAGSVSCISTLCHTSEAFLTCGEDGGIKFWKSSKLNDPPTVAESKYFLINSTSTNQEYQPTQSNITSVASMKKQNIVALGTKTGYLHVVYVDEDVVGHHHHHQNILKFVSQNIGIDGEIDILCFDEHDTHLAIASTSGDTVYVMTCDYENQEEPFVITGMWSATATGTEIAKIISVAWFGQTLVFLDSNGFVYGANASRSWDKNYLEGESLPIMWSIKPENIQNPMSLHLTSSRTFVLVSKTTNVMKTYKLPSNGDTYDHLVVEALNTFSSRNKWWDTTSITAVTEKKNKGNGENINICSTALSVNGCLMAVGTTDGIVAVFEVNTRDGCIVQPLAVNKVYDSPIQSLSFSRNCTILYSCAKDGSMVSCKLDGASPEKLVVKKSGFDKIKSKFKSNHNSFVEETSSPSWVDTTKVKRNELREKENDLLKAGARGEVRALAKKLHTMLEANELCPDDEKLERQDFVLNIAAQENTKKQNENLAKELRLNFEKKNLSEMLIRSRILDASYDKMEVHSQQILSFENKAIGVSNFAVPKLKPMESKRLAQVMYLRAMELRDINNDKKGIMKSWQGMSEEASMGMSWLINEGILRPTADPEELLNRLSIRESILNDPKKNNDTAAATSAAATLDQLADDGISSTTKVGDIEKNPLLLMYPVYALRTPNQKRSQIILTLELIRQMKKGYNKHFEKLLQMKEEEMDKAEARVARIREIMNELGSNETIEFPRWDNVEKPSSFLDVTSDEIAAKPYETEAMRQKRLLAEEERKRREEEAKKDNVGERALKDMMNGTLEEKKNVLSVESLIPPDFVDTIPEVEWTDEMKVEVEAFNDLVKKVQEDAVRRKKELELELKKLRTELIEGYKTFDEKLLQVANLRVNAAKFIAIHELNVSRLGLGISRRESAALNNRKIESQLRSLNEKVEIVSTKVATLQGIYDDAKGELDNLIAGDKLLEKNFKKDISSIDGGSSLDQDAVKILFSLYKNRQRVTDITKDGQSIRGSLPNGGGATGRSSTRTSNRLSHRKSIEGLRRSSLLSTRSNHSIGGDSHGGDSTADRRQSLLDQKHAISNTTATKDATPDSQKDPFYMTDDGTKSNTKSRRGSMFDPEDIAPLSIEHDLPEGFVISEMVWSKLVELRLVKIQQEVKLKKANAKVNEIKRALQKEMKEEMNLNHNINALMQQKFETAQKIADREVNSEALVLLKQGQIEVEQQAVVTDYTNALLLPTSVVGELNNELIRYGNEKVKILEKTLEFRKYINLSEWEVKYLSAKLSDLEEHYKDFQFTRVTRNMKDLLTSEVKDKAKETIEKGEAQLNMMTHVHEGKKEHMQKTNAKIKSKIKSIEKENETLAQKLKDLQKAVEAREAIYLSRASGAGGIDPAAQASVKMKRVVNRKRLIDIARAQAEEIDFLKMELDRLRQRNFPSFSHAAKARMSHNPDEI